MKTASKIFTALIFLFLFAPIAILVIFSFNEARSLSVFSGFSFKWYVELFRDGETLQAVKNTLIVAVSASVIATVMGTAAAVGIDKLRSRYIRSILNTVTDIPMTNPDIITGISMMLMFVFVGRLFGAASSLNFVTLLIAHVTFCLPYVILQVLPKLQQMDRSLPEAAMDLGCTPIRAFFKAEAPELMPGIITGFIMSLTLSLDDFVISYFTSGNGFQTLPIRIYNMTKKTVTPKMYALATITFFVILALMLLSNLTDNDDSRRMRVMRKAKRMERRARSAERRARRLERLAAAAPPRSRRIIAVCAIAAAAIGLIAAYAASRSQALVLNVYNWGEYISDGSEGSMDVVKEFEKWYAQEYGQKVRVNYVTFASNEDMYAKLASGAVSYDVIIPSDYMIARLIDEDMLLPLDFENIPNYENIPENFRSLYYDPDNAYSVPYTYGIIGIIYDANKVDEADVGTWELMWNEKYAGQILQFNNSRDAFGTAMYRAGLDVNADDFSVWDEALDALIAQRPLVKSYVMDEIYNLMESGEAAIAAYYAGDYFTMADAQADSVDLRFYYPDPTNYFVDAMCIPSCCQNKELAERFINYMLSAEPAIANAEYIWYASPNRLVYEDEGYIEEMGEEAMEILYPDTENFSELYNKYAYRNLDSEHLSFLNTLWETLKIN